MSSQNDINYIFFVYFQVQFIKTGDGGQVLPFRNTVFICGTGSVVPILSEESWGKQKSNNLLHTKH